MKLFKELKNILAQVGMDEGEASAIAFMLLEDMGGLTRMDVLMDREPREAEALKVAAQRVAEGEPVQYVLGKAEFCGLTFHVEPGVLIPRPETQELVEQVAAFHPRRVLDIGTGSGCIAVSLALKMPEAEVTAIDISDDALRIAEANAKANNANVRFVKADVLRDDIEGMYEAIVSNPPYICDSEAKDMDSNVLDHEPHLALFVPDSDPLLFYRRIAELGLHILYNKGLLAFEINRRFGKEIVAKLERMGYTQVELLQDQFGNDRMVKAIKA